MYASNEGKTIVSPRPWHGHLPDHALAAHDSGNTGVQVAALLEEVQVALGVPLGIVCFAQQSVIVGEKAPGREVQFYV